MRSADRTSLIVGEQDVSDLRWAIGFLIDDTEDSDERDALPRLYVLRRRLEDAASRLERGRNGRSAAAR